MNRHSWDTTAPRRPKSKRSASQQSQPELGLVEAEAELIRVAWAKPHRVNGF